MPLLFSYGTLQQEAVQRATFGRTLQGETDALVGFEMALLTIADPAFVATSGRADHAIVRFNGHSASRVSGMALEVSEAELAKADRYEPAGYTRIAATLASGRTAWVYADTRPAVPSGDPATVTASCHCGLITLEIAVAPSEITDCNCTICRRYGVLWAYYSPRQISVRSAGAATQTYLWGERKIAFHRCPHCGCVSHWSALDPAHDRMGVNARLMPPESRAGARLRHLDGAVTERYLD